MEDTTAVQKQDKTFIHIWSFKRAPGCSIALLAKEIVDWRIQSWAVCEEEKKKEGKIGKHNIKNLSHL